MPPKRRRKFHGLYYHSSPPKVLPMNGNSNSSKTSGRDDSKEAFVVKPSSIRIWIHDKDVGKLTRVLWAGQGNRLRTETSTNPRVRKFLETVPYVLNTIKDVHQAVVDNNLDVLKSKTESPVPPSLITTKDSNGLTVMHKAAGLAHTRIVEYLLKVWPGGATDIDATGKTPLHWAASAKNNTRCYNLLVQAGADEEALDYRMKNAAYYKHKPHDIDRSLLTIVPEAPRVPQENHPDWSALVDEVGKLTSSQTDLSTENDNNSKEEENEPSINLLTSRSKVNTTEDTPEVDDIENGNSKLTIEEQAVMDAIEDEKIYEKQLSEKEANHEDTEDLDVDDTNGSPEVTPRNTPSPIPKDDNFDDDTDRKANDEPEVNGNNQNNDDDNLNANQDDQGANDNQTTNDQKDTTSSHTEDDPPKSTSGTSEDSPEVTSETVDSKKEEKEDCQAGSTEENHETMPAEEENEGTPKKVPVADQESREATPQEKCDEGSPEKGPSRNGNVTDENEKTENNTEETRENGDNNNKDNELKATNGKETDNPKTDDDKAPEESDNGNKLSEVEDQEIATNPDKANLDEDVDVKVASENEKNTRKTESAKSNPSKEESVSQTESTKSNILNKENIMKTESAKSTTSNEGSPTKPISAKSTTSNEGSPTKPISAKSTTSNRNLTNGINKDEEIHKQQETDQNEAPRVKTPSHKNADIENNNGQKYDEDDDDQEVIRSNGSIDENHNAIKSNGQKSATPVSPALEYEGVVQGEADDNQVQSQSGGYFANEGDRIQSVIDSGDMEQLAALVLNGEGKKLLGTRSTQPEIQAFLDNVPSYMNKIRRVHQAARNGNIRDLQAALDRRKFAIAKDEISPDGATPLHVATVFGHAGIIRYLGGRFPETTSAVDDNGRTALHYAATINDNGHFYNLLVNLGSNPKSLDKMGESAEYYKDNRQESMKVFSYQKLLKAFGADENLEDEMLSDQDKTNTNLNQLEIPIFRTEQGRYLAEGKCESTDPNAYNFQYELTAALGDPLIKGLTEIAEKRPTEPILYLANFLHNFAKNNAQPVPVQQSRQGTSHSVSGLLGQPTSGYSNNSVAPNTYNQGNGPVEETTSSPELDDASSTTDDRDEHGQSMLHFACARPHSRNALLTLIEESEVNITYRDELYRTARDVSLQANQPANAKQIDHYVLSLAAKGDISAFENMVSEGYDHILDITDDHGTNIVDFSRARGHDNLADFLETVQQFEETREEFHQQIRLNNMQRVKELVSGSDPARLIRTKNYYGRTALHIAVLKENEALVDYLTDLCRNSLKIGDNLERTALHYAMGINSVEKISRILIRKGAKRIVKDLKGRQPSYYFMNKADILRLQEEEDEDHGIE